MNTRVCAVFLNHTEKLELQSITHNTFRHCRARFYILVELLFSKQLYVTIFKW